MGLINAQTAKAYGCRVIVSEMIPKKIETAKAMGFEVIDCNESAPGVLFTFPSQYYALSVTK